MENPQFYGTFTSTGANVLLPFVSEVDYIIVKNLTQLAADQTTAVGVSYEWFSTMPSNSMIAHYKSDAADAANLDQYLTTGGFTLYDSSKDQPGALHSTITAISNASIPVATNSGTNGLVAGQVVRLSRVAGGQQLGGYDFTVGYNTLSTTTFSLDYMAEIVAATTGSWRVIPYNPYFYPPHRFITSITSSGTSTVVVTSVTHNYLVGQEVRFLVSAAFGMTEINNLIGTITAVNTSTTVNSFTVNIDSSSFTAFAFPVSSNNAFTPALVVPVGENTSVALANGLNILGDATKNTATKGLILQGGAGFPAGASSDVIVWYAFGSAYNAIVPANPNNY